MRTGWRTREVPRAAALLGARGGVRQYGPSCPKPVPLFAASIFIGTGQARVTLSLRQGHLRAACLSRQEESGPKIRANTFRSRRPTPTSRTKSKSLRRRARAMRTSQRRRGARVTRSHNPSGRGQMRLETKLEMCDDKAWNSRLSCTW